MHSTTEALHLAKALVAIAEERKSQELIIALLEQTEAPFSRHQFQPGHITCTALILHPDRKRILLAYHHRHQRWLLPGGHVEKTDATLAETARREALEETGARIARRHGPGLVGVDVHGIAAHKHEPFHLHHDLIFAFEAETEEFASTEEAPKVAWCGKEELELYSVPNIIRYAAGRAGLVVEQTSAEPPTANR